MPCIENTTDYIFVYNMYIHLTHTKPPPGPRSVDGSGLQLVQFEYCSTTIVTTTTTRTQRGHHSMFLLFPSDSCVHTSNAYPVYETAKPDLKIISTLNMCVTFIFLCISFFSKNLERKKKQLHF